MKFSKRIVFSTCAAVAILFSGSALAAKPVTSGDGPTQCSGGLKIATGPSGKGYANLYRDLAAVCGEQIRTCEVRTSGGLDNLSALSGKKADLGFAQIDTIRDMSPGDENIAALQVVTTLNYNYLHVLTSAAGYSFKGDKKWGFLPGDPQLVVIRKFSDLKGRTVALVGSAQLLGRALAQRQLKDYNMHFVDAPNDDAALAMVKAGTAQAMFTVGGAPHGAVAKLNTASGVTLIPFDEDLGGLYVVRKLNYKDLGVYNLKALAVQNVMVTRPFGAAKAGQVEQLRQCMRQKLEDLKDGEYEPAWNEMKIETNVDLPKFTAQQSTTAETTRRK